MTTMTKSRRVLLGLSGGVDSTAAALLLLQDGYEVTGFYFDVLSGRTETRIRAEKAAERLGIDLIYRDASEQFEKRIIENFCSEYAAGRTPNPCVRCNPGIKFQLLADVAEQIGAPYLATGHYAQVYYDHDLNRYFVKKGVNQQKDQSYMLYRLGQNILSKLLLPLGTVADKALTRELARTEGMENADLKDSQEICFVSGQDYANFLEGRQCGGRPGDFISKNGTRLGVHRGLSHYTVGQRKGLGITFGKPAFVISMDPKANTVTLGDEADLFQHIAYSEDNCFVISDPDQVLPAAYEACFVEAKIRYAAKPQQAKLYQDTGGRVRIEFETPQRAITPGQSVVFYKQDLVVGGGILI